MLRGCLCLLHQFDSSMVEAAALTPEQVSLVELCSLLLWLSRALSLCVWRSVLKSEPHG